MKVPSPSKRKRVEVATPKRANAPEPFWMISRVLVLEDALMERRLYRDWVTELSVIRSHWVYLVFVPRS